MKKLLFYQAIFSFCILMLIIASCSKDSISANDKYNSGNSVPALIQRMGNVNGCVSPAEANAVVIISDGFFNGRDIPFDANVDADPVTGKYFIENVLEATYTLKAIPANPGYKSETIQGVVVNGNYITTVNFSLSKN